MRPIKFRYVWKNKETGIIDTEIFDIKRIEEDELYTNRFSDPWELLSRDEYTNLTDKNNKEIYEGDIVKRDENPRLLIFTDNYQESEVFWKEGKFEIVYKNGCFWHRDGPILGGKTWEGEYYEVIGNIHENPELLNKEEATHEQREETTGTG